MSFLKLRILKLFLFLPALFIFSCASKKKMVYFNEGSVKEEVGSYMPVFHKDDLLSITVLGLEPASVIPFNLPVTNYNTNQGGYATGVPSPPGYLVDSEGMIEMPVIGKIKVDGLGREQASELIKEKLKSYLNNPTVIIRILNFKVTVLGEVRNPGTFTIPNERITLPEALGIAGDLNITAVRKSVLVVREINGKRSEFRVDLTTKELFSSPVYFLQQNDLVYVEPNKARINSSVVNASNVGIVISIVSLITTVAVLLSRPY